jgi:D-apiose dehydrogenase
MNAILGKEKAENTGQDNLETVRLIWSGYESAATGKKIRIKDFK